MDFGICLRVDEPAPDFAEHVRLVEAAGFRHLWIADTGLGERDVFMLLTLAALNSERLLLGPGVLQPFTRHMAVDVNAMETLEELAPGRTRLGLGVGGTAIVELGGGKATVDSLRRLIELSRRLMRGETVSADIPLMPMRDARLRFRSGPRPIWVAGTGDKLLKLAAEVTDGLLAHVGATVEGVTHVLGLLRERSAGRQKDLAPLAVSLFGYTSVSPSADPTIVAHECSKAVATLIRFGGPWARLAGIAPEEIAALSQAPSLAKAQTMVTLDAMRKLAITGTPDQCIERIERLQDAGLREITIVITGTKERVTESLRLFGDCILPRFA